MQFPSGNEPPSKPTGKNKMNNNKLNRYNEIDILGEMQSLNKANEFEFDYVVEEEADVGVGGRRSCRH